jgi:predicted membrane-bound mannosyltransferase
MAANRYMPESMPGWAPLADPPGRGRRRYRRGDGGWLLALLGIAAAAGPLSALLAYLLVTDPAAGLSVRSLLVLALAAAVVLVLVVRSSRAGAGSVLRTLAEYVTVALLAVLLVTTAGASPPAGQTPAVGRDRPAAVEQQRPDQASQLPPGIRHAVGAWSWLRARWREADAAIDRQERERQRAASLPHPTGGPAS